MNLNLSLKPEDLKKLLPLLRRAQPYLVGLALVAVFAYTAVVVNAAVNTKASTATIPAEPKISFDKATIQSLSSLQEVPGIVTTGTLGSGSPF